MSQSDKTQEENQPLVLKNGYICTLKNLSNKIKNMSVIKKVCTTVCFLKYTVRKMNR